MKLPQERSVHSEIFVIVQRFLQKLEAHKLNMIKTWESWLDTLEQYGGFERVTSRRLRESSKYLITAGHYVKIVSG